MERYSEFTDRYSEAVQANKESARKRNYPTWFGEVITYASIHRMFMELDYPDQLPEILKFTSDFPLKRFCKDVLSELSVANSKLFESPDRVSETQKFELLCKVATEIRHSRDYQVVTELNSIIGNIQKVYGLSEFTYELLKKDLVTLYLLSCDQDKFLIGTKGGDFWKRIKLPEDIGRRFEETQHLAAHYMSILPIIGKREAILVPDDPITATVKINLPKPAKMTEDLLEDAYYKQRYVVPFEGAEVRLRKAGDLRAIFLMQSGNRIIARFTTEKGIAIVSLNYENGIWTSPDQLIKNIPNESNWVAILAEVYHDLVTAIEISTTKYRKFMETKTNESNDEKSYYLEERPEIIYIPRKVKTGENSDPRLPYSGPPRPIKPHRVSNYFRKGNMTLKQRLIVSELEQQLGIEILKFVPRGKTFVRPHVSPADSMEEIKYLPVFIKKRIEERLQKDLQNN